MTTEKTDRSIKEKSARMPELREQQWEVIFSDYLNSIKGIQSESARSHRFLLLLNELFGIQPEFIDNYVAGIETFVKVRQKDGILKGKIDELFGNLVIEFEQNIAKKQKEAEEQLKRYIACLWSNEQPLKRTPYVCIGCDGITFVIYSPIILNTDIKEIHPEDVQLNLLEKRDISGMKPRDIYFWLDRYFCRKETLSPNTENIIKDFGVNSHAFQMAELSLLALWKNHKIKPEFSVVYENWGKYLEIVYGTSVAEDELFCRHTYLATIAKLMAWKRIEEQVSLTEEFQLLSVLEGKFFDEQGIKNFLEEDFFSWIIREDVKEKGTEIAQLLVSLLYKYNLREISEDVLKSLYQELVDPKTRHDLGEFYTPDWLAHRMVQKLVNINPEGSFFDPSCGSGTFLYLIIREKRDILKDTKETLKIILNSVFGADIHPLAVIIAKTNYILALGDLFKKRFGKINIPVYLSDTLKPPERWMKHEDAGYIITIDNTGIIITEELLDDPLTYDDAIDITKQFAIQNLGKKVNEPDFVKFLKHYPSVLSENKTISSTLFSIAKTLKGLIEINRDTIWAFVLKNMYKPLFLKEKFDFIVGNPPWLAYRYAEPNYQKFLKERIIKGYHLFEQRGELITHLELGTLFLLRAAHFYLKESGTIAFVLPRSIFTADQHDTIRQGKFSGVYLKYNEVWDLDEVSPLFKVPSCVLIAQKSGKMEVSYPIAGLKISGKLFQRNAKLIEAQDNLKTKEIKIYLHKKGNRTYWETEESKGISKESYYKKYFFQGATIVPRSCWFIDIKTFSLGIDPNNPPIESSERAVKEAKEPYKGLKLSGNIENYFIYHTLLSTDIIPFGFLNHRLVLLPIEPIGNKYRMISINESQKMGFFQLRTWLEKAEKEWINRKGLKARTMNIFDRLDRYRGLSRQNSKVKYKVLYNVSGTYLTSCIVENKSITHKVELQKVNIMGFIADCKTYYFETDNKDEALYLSGMLNSPIVDELIKPMQSRGQWGPRDIHKKVLELSIPKFNESNKLHQQLVKMSEQCMEKVARWKVKGKPDNIKSIGVLRSRVRELLKPELDEIDSCVKQILEI